MGMLKSAAKYTVSKIADPILKGVGVIALFTFCSMQVGYTPTYVTKAQVAISEKVEIAKQKISELYAKSEAASQSDGWPHVRPTSGIAYIIAEHTDEQDPSKDWKYLSYRGEQYWFLVNSDEYRAFAANPRQWVIDAKCETFQAVKANSSSASNRFTEYSCVLVNAWVDKVTDEKYVKYQCNGNPIVYRLDSESHRSLLNAMTVDEQTDYMRRRDKIGFSGNAEPVEPLVSNLPTILTDGERKFFTSVKDFAKMAGYDAYQFVTNRWVDGLLGILSVATLYRRRSHVYSLASAVAAKAAVGCDRIEGAMVARSVGAGGELIADSDKSGSLLRLNGRVVGTVDAIPIDLTDFVKSGEWAVGTERSAADRANEWNKLRPVAEDPISIVDLIRKQKAEAASLGKAAADFESIADLIRKKQVEMVLKQFGGAAIVHTTPESTPSVITPAGWAVGTPASSAAAVNTPVTWQTGLPSSYWAKLDASLRASGRVMPVIKSIRVVTGPGASDTDAAQLRNAARAIPVLAEDYHKVAIRLGGTGVITIETQFTSQIMGTFSSDGGDLSKAIASIQPVVSNWQANQIDVAKGEVALAATIKARREKELAAESLAAHTAEVPASLVRPQNMSNNQWSRVLAANRISPRQV